jgi:hypothetical protein
VTLGDMIVARLEADLKNASLETCLEAVFGHCSFRGALRDRALLRPLRC